ncbi:MAG: hypothetical protein WAV73_01440 [Candidatus Moraniibacteriota bacterium]
MSWHPFINVQIKHDLFDVFSLVLNSILGTAAIASLWISRKVLKKSEFDSAMSTAPSIIVRPVDVFLCVKNKQEDNNYMSIDSGKIIEKPYEVIFSIEFECFNSGRGVAFNISQPKSMGISIYEARHNKAPLYLTLNDDPFVIKLRLEGKFDELYNKMHVEIPISVVLTYTNDQNNIFCRSVWQANMKLFDCEGENLKVRDARLLQINGKIEYSQVPYEN